MSKAVEEKDLVWAKMRGYPHWPAKIIKPPKGVKTTAHKLFVFFYGTHEHAWLLESEVFPYEKFCDKFNKPSNRKGFMEGIRELEEELVKIRKRRIGKKMASPGKQKPAEVLSPQKHPSPTTGQPTASAESSGDNTIITDSDATKGKSTITTVNQEDGKKCETDQSCCDLTASTDVFFLSPEDSISQEEAPILIRKRKALRSLSHEPVKRTRSHDDPAADSLTLPDPASHLSPPGGGDGGRRIPSARATRSLTPHHYVAARQQATGVVPFLGEGVSTLQQGVPVGATKLEPQMQKEDGSEAGKSETERGVGELVQTSSDAPEQMSSEDGLAYFLSMGEEDKTGVDTERDNKRSPHNEKGTKEVDQSESMDYTSQTETKHSPNASHSEEEKASLMEQSVTETEAISNTASPEKAAGKSLKHRMTKSTATTSKGSEVTSPRRYSTRRLGLAQGSTVEKLTQSYTARLEQALGSPDAQKKKPLTLQSPKRSTPKGAKASPKAPVTSGGGKISRRSRGKAESEEGGGGEGEKEETEKGEGGGGDDDEGVITGADSQAVSEPSTPQVADVSAKEREGAKSESKREPGRRKSARLSSKTQQASTPSGGGNQRKTASSAKKQKEPRSAGKKRSRQTSDSSLDYGSEEPEVRVKTETVDDTGQVAASKDGMEGETKLQGEVGDSEAAPVVKKQSKRGRKSQTAATASGEKATKPSKPQAPSSGGRVLRARQKGVAGSKDKSQPKKMKLEEPSEESLASESQQQQQQSSSLEASEDKPPQQESEEAKHDEASSDSKRVLRKRKQPSGGGASAAAGSSSKRAATSRSTAQESTANSAESSSKSTPTRQSKRHKVAPNGESESMDETGKPATDKGSEELIIRVPTSVTNVNDSAADKEITSEATVDKTEMANDTEPTSKNSTPSISTDSNGASGDQVGSSGGQSADTGGQEKEAPPTTHPPGESSSKADPPPSSSSSSGAAVPTAAAVTNNDDGEKGKTEAEKDKVELPKKIDSSELPPMIRIRAGMSTVEVLQAYNYNIKASLVIDAPNVSKALTALRDLKELQFSATDLEKVPDLVYTVRKLKHYHASSKVVRRAEEVYGKLKGLYMYPKLVPRPLKKKAVGGAGIRKRPPTMAEYLNTQTKKQKPSQLSRSQTLTKSKSSTGSALVTSNRTKGQSPAPPSAPETEAGGITDVISKKPTSDEIKAAHAPIVPQLTEPGSEKISKDDEEQPNQQLAEETKVITTAQSRDVPTASTDVSSTSTSAAPPSESSSCVTPTPTTSDALQAFKDSIIVDAEQSGTPLQVGGDVNLAEAANIETKGSSAPLLTGSESFAAGLSCPNVNERSSEDTNLLQSEAKTHGQAATPIIQADVHSLGAGGNDSSVGESKSEEKCQREANPPLQTSGHSLAVDASSSSVSGSSSEGKSQEAKEDGESDQIVPS